MFVGEVREAILGDGTSWKLSGGSQLSASQTKVSKKCHVAREVVPRKARWSAVRFGTLTSIGWLIHQAIHGAASHRPRIGYAPSPCSGR